MASTDLASDSVAMNLLLTLSMSNPSPVSDHLIPLLDAALPQTQCGLCGHPAGCLPYATAMIQAQEPANKCVPGGQPVADQLAKLLDRPTLPVEPSDWPIAADGRPQRVRAVIREDECIGCTKCIAACPVDAIIGSGKLMHSVITDWCTGCELCLPPCPVDCIDLVDWPVLPTPEQQLAEQQDLRQRYQARNQREARRTPQLTARRQPILSPQALPQTPQPSAPLSATLTTQANDPQLMVQQATLRSQIGKLQRQLRVRADLSKQAELEQLQTQLRQLGIQS
ncbi:MAG: RnfABCDGE type electron transport complex subunit B [Pseudomonadota bacterium]|nr:RnfABCDGE type electron transport complex subunit B [Pseudomonadota bacterium]